MNITTSPLEIIMVFAYGCVLFIVSVFFGDSMTQMLRAAVSGVGGFMIGVSFFVGMTFIQGQNQEQDDDKDDDFHNRLNGK